MQVNFQRQGPIQVVSLQGSLDVITSPDAEKLLLEQIDKGERNFVLDLGTKETGGQRVTLLADSAVIPALAKLARELSSQYKVVYGRPESLIPSQKTEITSGKKGVSMHGAPARGQTGA